MDEKNTDTSRLLEFIEKKIAELKQELEYYEKILALIEKSTEAKRSRGHSGEELEVDGKTVALFTKRGSELSVKLLSPASQEKLKLEHLRQKIALVVPVNFSMDVEKEGGLVTLIRVGNLKSPSNVDAAVKMIKKHLETVYGGHGW